MASASKCDRCGTLYEPPKCRPYISLIEDKHHGTSYFDLCPKCQSELEKWLEERW